MGNCHSSKINVDRGEAAVDIGFRGLTISHVNLSCSNIYIIIDHLYKKNLLAKYNQPSKLQNVALQANSFR